MTPRARSLASVVLFALAALFSSGCVYTRYTKGDITMTRISLFGNQTIGKVDMVNGTMEGYQSEQAAVASAAAEGFAKGLVRP